MSLLYDAPPTLRRFMRSDSFGRIAAGPVGSGKTTACVIELLRRAIQQAPAPDGYRWSRVAIVRQTLKQLKDTVLKDCSLWLEGLSQWRVSENTFLVEFGDVKSEWIFIPLEDASDQARLLSMQLTMAWISEAIECNFDILAPISGRIGRYPSGGRGVPTFSGIIADTNMPAEETDWHRFMENLPPDWSLFRQPSGVSPQAENLDWLLQTDATIKLPVGHPDRIAQGRRYYERFLEMYGSDHPWVKRFVYAEYGNDPSGEAVFRATFNRAFHVRDTMVVPGYNLILAQDFGRNPWTLICQVDHLGRLLVHEEIAATNIGLEKHIEQNVRPRLYSGKYSGLKVVVVGDPSGVAKGTISEESCFDALKRLGLPAFPAPTNDIDKRLRAVEQLLGRQVNGGPALVINGAGCPMLVRAMNGGYRFKRHREGALRAVPEKFDVEGFSHVCDDLQYASLIVSGGLVQEMARRLVPRTRRQERPRVSAAGWT
jgi:hypothetical protein